MKKIVIVDDELNIRILLKQTLERLCDDNDVEIYTADNGRKGLELIKEKKPDLVFLDVMMPLLNGYEVCKEVRADIDLRGVYIIMLSAKGQTVDKTRGYLAGIGEYMTKPFDPDEIVGKAKSILGL